MKAPSKSIPRSLDSQRNGGRDRAEPPHQPKSLRRYDPSMTAPGTGEPSRAVGRDNGGVGHDRSAAIFADANDRKVGG